MPGIQDMVNRIDDEDGPYKTISEVAEYFERTTDTIRRWSKTCGLPTHKMPLGKKGSKSFVWLWTEEDIKALEKYAEGVNPKGGRPPKKKDDQK